MSGLEGLRDSAPTPRVAVWFRARFDRPQRLLSEPIVSRSLLESGGVVISRAMLGRFRRRPRSCGRLHTAPSRSRNSCGLGPLWLCKRRSGDASSVQSPV